MESIESGQPESDEGLLETENDELQQDLRALYRPGCYHEGEELCLEILEEIDSESQLATLFLMLNLAAQNIEEDTLSLVDELDDESIFEALRSLAFGEGTQAESILYDELVLCAQERGLSADIEAFFHYENTPLVRHETTILPEPWNLPKAAAVEPTRPKKTKKIIRRIKHKVKRNRATGPPAPTGQRQRPWS